MSRDNAKIPTKSLTVRRDRASQSVKLTCEYLLQAGKKELAYISRIQVPASQRILHGNEIQPECKKEISLSWPDGRIAGPTVRRMTAVAANRFKVRLDNKYASSSPQSALPQQICHKSSQICAASRVAVL